MTTRNTSAAGIRPTGWPAWRPSLSRGLAEPAPAGFAAGRDVDWDKVQHLIFSDAPPEARAAIRAGELRWALFGFDGTGWGSVSVFRADNGEEVAGARCHWSAIVKRDVTEPS